MIELRVLSFVYVEDYPLRCDVEKFQAILLFCTMEFFYNQLVLEWACLNVCF